MERGSALLRQMEEVEALLHSRSGRIDGHLRLSSFSTASRGLVASLLARLRSTAPDLHVTLTENEPWQSVDLVAHGQVELAIVHNWEPVALQIPAHLRALHLGSDRADVLLHRESPLATKPSLTPRALVDQRWVSVAPGSICHEWLTRMFHHVGVEPRIDYYSQEFDSHVALVAHGVASALVPRLGRGALPADVVAIPVRDPVPRRTVTVIWRRTMTESPAVAHVVGELTSMARTGGHLDAG